MARNVLMGLSKWRKTPGNWNPLGVNAGPAYPDRGKPNRGLGTLSSTFLRRYQAIGVRGVRTHDFYGPFDMSWYDRELDGDRDFGPTSECLAEILDGGFDVYLRIGYSHPNRLERMAYPATIKSKSTQEAFCRAAVAFAREVKDQAGSRLKYVEIWNEPDLVTFWPWSGTKEDRAKQGDCKKTFEAFCKLYVRLAKALRAELGTGVKIGGPGFTQRADDNPDQCKRVVIGNRLRPAREFLEYVDGHGSVPLDFFSWHLYLVRSDGKMSKVDVGDLAKECKTMRGFIAKTRMKKAPFHLTEWGFDPSVRGKMNTALGVSKLTSYWLEIIQGGIEQAFFYRGHGNPALLAGSESKSSSNKATVLVEKDGNVTLAGSAFRLWSMFWEVATGPDGRLLRVATRDLDDDDGIGLTRLNMAVPALAACNRDGAALLVTNDTDENLDYRFKIPDRGIVSGKVCRVERIAGNGNPGTYLPDRDKIRLNRCATHLVLVTWAAMRSGARTASSFGSLPPPLPTAKVTQRSKTSTRVRVKPKKTQQKKTQPKKTRAAGTHMQAKQTATNKARAKK